MNAPTVIIDQPAELRSNRYRHGHKTNVSATRTYMVWTSMRQRCNNPKVKGYARYGGRGIKVCPRWDDYVLFLADMGEAPLGLTLERKDNDKGYSKSNCVWATRAQQNRNTSQARMLSFNGETMNLCDWAIRLGITANAFAARIYRGWSPERLFITGKIFPKLTAGQVLAIRADTRSPTVIARELGVTDSLIHSIRRRRVWKHL